MRRARRPVKGTILRDRLLDDVLRIVRKASRERSVVEHSDIVARLMARQGWSESDFLEGLSRAVSRALQFHRREGRMEYKRRLRLGWRTWWD